MLNRKYINKIQFLKVIGVIIMENITLKKYTDDYYDFVYEVKKNAYKKYVEECWGTWNEKTKRSILKVL